MPTAENPVSLALLKAAEAAWSKYNATVRMCGTREQRAYAYQQARKVEQQIWTVLGVGACKA